MPRQPRTPSGDKVCPDCRQKLSEKQTPCAYVGTEPVWCATCESEDRPQVLPAHRPRRDPTAARVSRGLRCKPVTWEGVDVEAKRTGKSAGEVLDWLVATFLLFRKSGKPL